MPGSLRTQWDSPTAGWPITHAGVKAGDDVRRASAGQWHVYDGVAECNDGLSLRGSVAERRLGRCIVHGAERTEDCSIARGDGHLKDAVPTEPSSVVGQLEIGIA